MQKYNLFLKPAVVLGFVFFTSMCYAQGDLLSQLGENQSQSNGPVRATFKSARIINGHSIETRDAGALDVIISHRFGRLNSGIENFFGLDEANIRLGVDYSLSDRLTIGVGRSSFKKIYDGFLKYRLLRQTHSGMPLSVTAFVSGAIETQDPPAGLELDFKHRVFYASELLIARKFSPGLSLQLMPVWIHRNLVDNSLAENDVFAIGVAGRQKITKRTALTFEYYYQLNNDNDFAGNDNYNSLGIGVDIETGGHVFQLHVTNSRSIVEKEFIAATSGNFFEGDIHFGFNVIRVFHLKKPEMKRLD